MKTIKIPYHTRWMDLCLENDRIAGILHSQTSDYITAYSEEEIIMRALQAPISSPGLGKMAESVQKVLLITSDHTRPVPSKVTLPIILAEIRSRNPNVEIKILIATGFHRLTTYEEMINKFGKDIVESEQIINHDSRDGDNMVFKGIMPSGGELWLNSLVDWADLVVSEGFIEPHFFAGFSGGRKSILPGIASEKTVFANHCSKFIADGNSRTGNLIDNPIHCDMLFAAKAAKLKFILNVVINKDKKVINAFAGDPEEAHRRGCDFVEKLSRVRAIKSDIVITSNGGYPLDQNIYQTVKGMTAAEACVASGGVIIIVSGCIDGHGGDSFYSWFTGDMTPDEILDKINSIKQEDTDGDQWQAQILARILTKCSVIIVSDICDPCLVKNMQMLHAPSLNEALEIAEKITGSHSKITVIPDGVSVIVE